MRLFVAVETPPEHTAALATACERGRRGGVLWVPVENAHLTLKFLGETAEARVGDISAALAAVAAATPPFTLAFGGAGCFPHERAPRVLWLGVREGADDVRRLAAAVERALVAAGFPAEERPWRGHLTIGRIKDPRVGAATAAAKLRELAAFATPAAAATTLNLYRSTLTPEGAVYAAVSRHALGGETLAAGPVSC